MLSAVALPAYPHTCSGQPVLRFLPFKIAIDHFMGRAARARPQSGPRGPAPRQILEPGFKMNLGSCSRVALGPWCQNESRRPVAHCIWEPRLKMNLGTLPPTYPGARPRRRIPHPGLKAKPGALPQSESPSLVPNLISKSCRKPNREDQK